MSVPGLLKNFVAAQEDSSSFSDEHGDQKMDRFRDEKSLEAKLLEMESFEEEKFELITALEELEALKASEENQV